MGQGCHAFRRKSVFGLVLPMVKLLTLVYLLQLLRLVSVLCMVRTVLMAYER
jgi:hypothetical protein